MQDRVEIPEKQYSCGEIRMTNIVILTLLEAMIPSGVLTKVCSELSGISDQLKISMNENLLEFKGTRTSLKFTYYKRAMNY